MRKYRKWLHKLVLEHRKKGRKVSTNFVRMTYRKRMKALWPVQADALKVSAGWFLRFFKGNKIKIRKRKSGTKYDDEVNLDKIIKTRIFLISIKQEWNRLILWHQSFCHACATKYFLLEMEQVCLPARFLGIVTSPGFVPTAIRCHFSLQWSWTAHVRLTKMCQFPLAARMKL